MRFGARGAKLAIVGTALTLACGCSTALGSPGLKTRSTPVLVSGSVAPYLGTATAKCTGSSKLISGGFSGPGGSVFSQPSNWVYEAFRSGVKTFRVSAFNDGVVDGITTSFAYCLKDLKVKSVSATTPVPNAPPYTATATAQCPKGTKVVGGGFRGSFDPNALNPRVYPSRSEKQGSRSWAVDGFLDNNTPGGTITATAYCRAGERLKTRSASGSASGATQIEPTAVASCKKGERLLSGGFETPGFNAATGPVVYFTRSFKSGSRTWTASGHSTVAATVTSHAYCGKT